MGYCKNGGIIIMILTPKQYEVYLGEYSDTDTVTNNFFKIFKNGGGRFTGQELARLLKALRTNEDILSSEEETYYQIATEDGYLYYSKLYLNLAFSETPVRVSEKDLKSVYSQKYIDEHKDLITPWED